MSAVQSSKIYILATSSEPNNVIFEHAGFAKAAGLEPIFVFPYRAGDQAFNQFYSGYKTIRLNFNFATNSPFAYLLSSILLMFYATSVLSHGGHRKHILAIDLPATIACIFLKLGGAHIHTLLNDNFSARYEVSPRMYKILRAIESSALRMICTSCIFPDKSRYALLGSPAIKRIYFVPNILKDDYAPPYQGSEGDKLIVMFCGWLVQSRGIELLKDILINTSTNVEFLLVGSGDEELLQVLAKNVRVKYVGHVSREENLEMMSKVDINIAFYNPRILINRYALPQKIYDSLMIACPLFVNCEVEMSGSLQQAGACFVAEYYDVLEICKKLNELAQDKTILGQMSRAMLKYGEINTSFRQAQVAGINVYSDILKA